MTKLNTILLLIILAVVLAVPANSARADRNPVPPKRMLDFTKGDQVPESAAHDWTLGPIGARGWCQAGGKGNAGDTAKSRQILITNVDSDGPSSNRLVEGDVILGVGKTRFQSDARIAFARSIEPAESSDGKLQLEVFRGGEVKTVTIVLPKLPAFADAAPYNCRKSKTILDAGCQGIQRRGLGRPSLENHLNALTLLATGDDRYRETVADYARMTISKPLKPTSSLPCWSFSFTNLFLCEYYLATGDSSVLKEIRRLTDHLVRGQGPLGTWGHSFVDVKRNRLKGYGAVNAVGLPVAISLVLANECGVEVEGLENSIALSASFFRRHVHLGAIPYGDGPPNLQFGHDDNGKNSAAAIFFNLLGEREAAEYYVRTALAAHGKDREQGHTGNFFNMFWSMPAVSLAGPEASGAWLKEFGWYYDLARDNQLRFPYQGYPKQGKSSVYAKWDCPGAYLLHLAVPLKKLRITGRNVKRPISFTTEEIADAIAAGKWNYREAKPADLQRGLASWSPIVRKESARELRRRKIPFVETKSLTAHKPLDRIAALQATGEFPASAKLLEDSNDGVRIAAFKAMVRIDREKAWLATVEHLASHPDESPVFTQAVGSTFFPLTIKPAASGKLLNAPANRQSAAIAIRRLLNDEDCLVSSRVAIGLRALPESELATLLPLIYEKAQQGSLGNVMFSNKLQTSCAEVLTKLKLQEGVETSAQLLADTSWGKHNRMPQAAKLLKSFGGHAKKYQPMLREAVETLNGDGNAKWRELINDTIRLIEEAPEVTGKLPSLQSR